MRSSFLLSAVCAAGVMGTPLDLDKRAYETEWSFFTVTSTTTGQAEQQQMQPATAETVTLPPTTSTLDSVTTTPAAAETTAAPAETTAAAAQNTAQAEPAPSSSSSDNGGNVLDNVVPTGWTSSFSTAWTSTPTQAPQQTTMTSSATDSGASPTNHYQETLLYNHNIHRSNHSADSLSWSNTLEASAQKLAARCVYEHDTSIDGGGYGQNIGYGVSTDNIGKMITDLMYNDEMGFFTALYGIASPLMELFDSWGHFTQIVWKSTKEVGCATVMCDHLGKVDSGKPLPFTVCNYSPAGNANGEYADNVLQPLGHAVFSL